MEDTMKSIRQLLTITVLAALSMLAFGCDHFDNYDHRAPEPPRNISTVTGDNRVDVYWDDNTERDLAGYNVYYSYSYHGDYELIGSTETNSFVDYGASNGVTYYYAVTAYDYNGNESDLSSDVVYDTPRPEGFNQAIFDYNLSPNNSGYDFSDYLVVPFDDNAADFFFENYNGEFYLDIWDDSDIQDMGSTNDIWDISYAPSGGWVDKNPDENIKYVKAVPGHTYVIWTWDNHFAKVRIKTITNERVVFDWAYQLVEGNKELKRSTSVFDRNHMPTKVLRSR